MRPLHYPQWYAYPDGLQHKCCIAWDDELQKYTREYNITYERLACGKIVVISIEIAEHKPKCMECLAVEIMYILEI